MSGSRKPDNRRFALQMTDEGPRFVLAGKEPGVADGQASRAEAKTNPPAPSKVEGKAAVPAPPKAEAKAVAPAPQAKGKPPVPQQKGKGKPAVPVRKGNGATVTPAAAKPTVPEKTVAAAPPPAETRPAVPEKTAAPTTPPAPVSVAKTPAPAPVAKTPADTTARKEVPSLVRPSKVDAPTQTHTVLDAEGSDRLPNAFWKAALPPQTEVAADYTVEKGVERVHAPVATPAQAIGLMKEAEYGTDENRSPVFFSDRVARAGSVRVPRVVIAALVAVLIGVALITRMLPEPTQQEVLVARADRFVSNRARLAQSNASRLFARGLDGELQRALESGLYVVVGRKEDGTMSNENIVEDMMTRDLESAQKLARIKSDALGQPLFIIARRNGDVAVVERVNPGDRNAWRDYSMNVWYLKQHALGWSRERYMSREALDPKLALAVMSEFVRTHPDSRVVGPALEDIRYVCYYNLQDPSKFQTVAVGLLDEALRNFDRQKGGNVPELVYVMKPYLKEAMNQFLYQRIHRLTAEQARIDSMLETSDLGAPPQI